MAGVGYPHRDGGQCRVLYKVVPTPRLSERTLGRITSLRSTVLVGISSSTSNTLGGRKGKSH